jgi:quinol monooxygenase YgiN
MDKNVYWVLELEVQAGREKDGRVLAKEMVASARANEPGTLQYAVNTSADGKRCHTYERNADSAAALAHIHTFGEKFAARFLEVFKPVRFVVYGSPSQPVRDALAAFGPVYMNTMDGFSR